jgi:hypothetical protein
MQGNALSYLYSVEWPAFAVVAGIGWWQMFHDTPEDIERRKEHHARMRAASAQVVARTLPRSARAITVGSEEVDSRSLPGGTAAVEIGPGGSGRSSLDTDFEDTSALDKSRDFTGSPLPTDEEEYQAILLTAAEEESGPADAMTDYNRYLALLAVKGKPKTWRNPRGL